MLHKCFLPNFEYCVSVKSRRSLPPDMLFSTFFYPVDNVFFELATVQAVSLQVSVCTCSAKFQKLRFQYFSMCQDAWMLSTSATVGCVDKEIRS